jgi:hypothetical protein
MTYLTVLMIWLLRRKRQIRKRGNLNFDYLPQNGYFRGKGRLRCGKSKPLIILDKMHD